VEGTKGRIEEQEVPGGVGIGKDQRVNRKTVGGKEKKGGGGEVGWVTNEKDFQL